MVVGGVGADDLSTYIGCNSGTITLDLYVYPFLNAEEQSMNRPNALHAFTSPTDD